MLVNFYGFWILIDLVPLSAHWLGLAGLARSGRFGWCPAPFRQTSCLNSTSCSCHMPHFDHLDTPSLAMVPGLPAAVMAVGTSDLLPWRAYSSVTEFAVGLRPTRVRGRHGDLPSCVRLRSSTGAQARLRRDAWRGYTGFVVEREGLRLLIAGDTAGVYFLP